jgi:dienelactone hydrolase
MIAIMGLRLKNLLRFTAATIVVAYASTFNVRAEIVAIPAPHLGDGKTLRAQLFVPQGKVSAPRAAAILLHGCGGVGGDGKLNARHTMWKDWLLERGFIAIFPESFTSRGYAQVCTEKFQARTIKQRDRVDDVIATRQWLLAKGGVDAHKLVLWGWSHGGGATLATITRSARVSGFSDEVKFAQAISFYPGCAQYANAKAPKNISSPLALIVGDADDWTPAAPCKDWIAHIVDKEPAATITLVPGAFHDFDNPTGKLRVRKDVPNGVNPGQGVTVGPDPAGLNAVKAQLDALLRERGLMTSSVSKPATSSD